MRWFPRVAAWALVFATGLALAGAYEDFFRAIARDDDRAVKSLLERGFDPNSVDERGQPALIVAMRDDAPRVAAALLAHPKIEVDRANPVGETALMMAALHGRAEWVPRLLERGSAVQRDGWTPLHYAATGPDPKLVVLLLERGAAVDAPSPNRSTPLMMAARYGDEQSVTLLLARGADPKLRNDREMNAADFARSAGRDRLAARLDALAR